MEGITTHICDNPNLCYQDECKSIGMIVGTEIIVGIKIVSCVSVKTWYELKLKKKYIDIKYRIERLPKI